MNCTCELREDGYIDMCGAHHQTYRSRLEADVKMERVAFEKKLAEKDAQIARLTTAFTTALVAMTLEKFGPGK